MDTWFAEEATGTSTVRTQALLERLRPQKEGIGKDLVEFWSRQVTSRAQKIDGAPHGLRILAVDVSSALAEKVCAAIRMDPLHRECCFVCGANLTCFVLGTKTPPEGLFEWVVVHVEGKRLENVV